MSTPIDRRVVSSFAIAAVLFGVFVCAAGCETERRGRESERSQKKEVREEVPKGHYWLNVKVDQFKGSYTLLCNGFPVKRMWVNIIESDDEWAADMQTALIGEGNVASIRIRPFLDYSGKRLTVGTVQLEGWVEVEETRQSYVPLHKVKGAEKEGRLRAEAVDSAYTDWKKQVTGQWEELLEEKETPKAAFIQLKTWRWENPIEVETTPFENRHGPNFSKIFEEAPVIKDTPATRKRLKDYAMHLRELISNHDGPGLYRELRPAKNAAYRQQGITPPSDSARRADWAAAAEKRVGWFQPGRSAGTLTRDRIGLRKWVEGRVWELYKEESGEPLFGESEIFVGEVNGELKVVRSE